MVGVFNSLLTAGGEQKNMLVSKVLYNKQLHTTIFIWWKNCELFENQELIVCDGREKIDNFLFFCRIELLFSFWFNKIIHKPHPQSAPRSQMKKKIREKRIFLLDPYFLCNYKSNVFVSYGFYL